MKIYKGKRMASTALVFVQEIDAGLIVGAHRLRHVVHHSPTGLEWGYGGSGPADTALSILADYFEESPTHAEITTGRLIIPCFCRRPGPQADMIDDIGPADPNCLACDGTGEGISEPLKCWQYHQPFKWAFIAKLPRDEEWQITKGEIATWVEIQEVTA